MKGDPGLAPTRPLGEGRGDSRVAPPRSRVSQGVLCCVVLRRVVSCCVVLFWCGVVRGGVLFCALLCCVVLCCVVLFGSWVDLGTHVGSNTCVFSFSFLYNLVKIQLFEKSKVSRGNLSRTWANLGAQEGAKMEPKREPRRSKKREEK